MAALAARHVEDALGFVPGGNGKAFRGTVNRSLDAGKVFVSGKWIGGHVEQAGERTGKNAAEWMADAGGVLLPPCGARAGIAGGEVSRGGGEEVFPSKVGGV